MGFKIAIIDPVGIKSGMNHYNTFLCHSLTKLEAKTFIYSNFEPDSEIINAKLYFVRFLKTKSIKFSIFLIGILKSCIDCKKIKLMLLLYMFFLLIIWQLLLIFS